MLPLETRNHMQAEEGEVYTQEVASLENNIIGVAKQILFLLYGILLLGVVKRMGDFRVHGCYVVNTEQKHENEK